METFWVELCWITYQCGLELHMVQGGSYRKIYLMGSTWDGESTGVHMKYSDSREAAQRKQEIPKIGEHRNSVRRNKQNHQRL